jgi:N-acetylneuraminate synthase/pseudaminic acid synthase
MRKIKIGEHIIGDGYPTFVIAEMSANHAGDFDSAIALIDAAKRAGANAVKLQTYRADTITLDCDKEDFLIPETSPWANRGNLYQLYQEAYTPWEWHEALFNYIKSLGMEYFSAPFDLTAVDFLADLDVPAYKIASPEITDIPLIKKVATKNKPVLISTGIAEQKDIDLAIKTLQDNGCQDIVILKCSTAYPAPLEECNLNTMVDFRKRYQCLNGISDHTLGAIVPTVAVTLGAAVIEKHLVLDKSVSSADSFFSLDEIEFTELVHAIRKTEIILGKVDYSITTSAKKNMAGRRSLYIAKDLKKGDVLNAGNLKSIRPSFGLHPKYYHELLGKRVNRNLQTGERASLDMIDEILL